MIAALIILGVVVLGLAALVGYQSRLISDQSDIKARLAADRETLLMNALMAKTPGEMLAYQRAATSGRGLSSDGIFRPEPLRNVGPDRDPDQPELPEGLAG